MRHVRSFVKNGSKQRFLKFVCATARHRTPLFQTFTFAFFFFKRCHIYFLFGVYKKTILALFINVKHRTRTSVRKAFGTRSAVRKKKTLFFSVFDIIVFMWSLFLCHVERARTCQRYTRTRAHVLGVARVRVSNQYIKRKSLILSHILRF